MSRFVFVVDLGPDMTFAQLQELMRTEADKLLNHPLPRERPTEGDTGATYRPDGTALVTWHIEDD